MVAILFFVSVLYFDGKKKVIWLSLNHIKEDLHKYIKICFYYNIIKLIMMVYILLSHQSTAVLVIPP